MTLEKAKEKIEKLEEELRKVNKESKERLEKVISLSKVLTDYENGNKDFSENIYLKANLDKMSIDVKALKGQINIKSSENTRFSEENKKLREEIKELKEKSVDSKNFYLEKAHEKRKESLEVNREKLREMIKAGITEKKELAKQMGLTRQSLYYTYKDVLISCGIFKE